MHRDKDISIDTIVAKIVAQRLDGKKPDLERVISAHPEFADELQTRFADLEKLDVLYRDLSAAGRNSEDASQGRVSAGAKLDEFEIIREIGRGGMGVVYLARQESLNRTVALKVIPQAASLSETTRKRFLRESSALAALSHPNIVPVFAAGESGGSLFMAMEYVDGVSLADILHAVRHRSGQKKASNVWKALVQGDATTDEPNPEKNDIKNSMQGLDREYIQACCNVITAIAKALHVAHENGIIHRDVKPANIMLDRQGRPRLLDFGLAAVNTQPHVTVSGEFFGTPNYVSPEQALGKYDQIDERTDVYSLGATLYECLTLSPPFDAPSAPEVLTQVVNDDAAPARKTNPSVARDLNTIVMKAIAKHPNDRYSSANAFADDIERFLDHRPIQAKPAGIPSRIAKTIRRKPVHATLLLILLIGCAGSYWLYGVFQESVVSKKQSEDSIRIADDLKKEAVAEMDKAKQIAAGVKARKRGVIYQHGGHINGVRVEKNINRAIKEYLFAAQAGNSDAMLSLGVIYYTGKRVEKDYRKTFEWFQKAAEAGDAEGMRTLALMYYSGKGIKRNFRKAAKWYRKSAQAGNTFGMCGLGDMYQFGKGVKRDYKEAVRWYRKSAEAGNSLGMCGLGLMYRSGKGVEKDYKEAFKWFQKAAKIGDPNGMWSLGGMYQLGKGVEQDYQEAIKWYRKSAVADNATGMWRLGGMYRFGQGVERDYKKAIKWYRKSAEAGNPFGMGSLGGMYESGLGVEKDIDKAIFWYRRAVKLGNKNAKVRLGLLTRQPSTATAPASMTEVKK